MFYPPNKWLAALAVAGVAVFPVAALGQESQSERDRESRQSDAQRDEMQRDRNRDVSDRDQSSWDYDRQQRQPRDDRSRQDDRSWADGSSNRQDDDQAGLGVTLDQSQSSQEGALVRRVHPNSPAEQMGLRPGDRITAVNGDDVESYRDLIEEVRDLEPGDRVRIEIQRDGDSRTLRGELESRHEALVFRGQRQDDRGRFFNRRERTDRWNPDRDRVAYYGDQSSRRQYSYEGGSSYQGQDLHQQLDSLERQVNQIRRQINDLRYAVDSGAQSRDDRSRESQAGYNEYDSQSRFGTRSSYDQWSDGNRGQQGRQYDRTETERSPGGQLGEERLRPGSDHFDTND